MAFDWELAMSRNCEALRRVIAALFALAGLAENGLASALPRPIYDAVLLVLLPAESAVRRLIIIAARGLVLKPRGARCAPVGLIPRGSEARISAFLLIDPLKRFAVAAPQFSTFSMPHISLGGFHNPLFAPQSAPSQEERADGMRLCRRLFALRCALNDLPKQARRLARWNARRDLQRSQIPFRPRRLSPFRPGRPPGFRKTPIHEVDHILRECHGLARDAFALQNTS